MSPLELGLLIAAALILVLLSGAPVAFSLGAVSRFFLVIFYWIDIFENFAQNIFCGLKQF